MGTSHSESGNRLTFTVWEWCRKRGVWISAAHIPGVLNTEVDEESRKINSNSEWKLDSRVLQSTLTQLKFTPSVDLFASHLNAQYERYVSFRPDPACEVEVAICCLWCILYFNTNLPLFLLAYCVSACMWMICGCIFLEKILNIFIHASPSASKIKFVWHCVIHQDIRKKHANNLRDLLWNLWAVSSLVNLPKKAKIRPGRQECKTLHILWQGRG